MTDTPTPAFDARANVPRTADPKDNPGLPDDVSDTADPKDPMTLRPGGTSEERLAAAEEVAAAQKQRDEEAHAKAEKARLKAEAEKARLRAIDDAKAAATEKAEATTDQPRRNR